MSSRRLVVAPRAEADLDRRARYLAEERGEAFAERYTEDLLVWLASLARTGARLGTAYGDDPTVRSFGCRKQATIVVRFQPATFRVLRVYFKGQDWRQSR